ncbi:hypothetical protein [Melghirimyces algeriensis]|uniref:Uncharacterized protein n=1 Tax=Melghirimyces algeriensis TaxID=910412 RepID=A0A521E3T5_9BACL|nr:hypothetical protein [Melghirimyces algeriensis]SMO78031.1 hypothetical protein SAMN06264849_107147 [Melghirimyces algeriensis]
MEWTNGYVIVPWNSILGISKPPIKGDFIQYTQRYALVDRIGKGLVGNYLSVMEASWEATVRYAQEVHNYHVDPMKWRPAAIELASCFYSTEELAWMTDRELGDLLHQTDWYQLKTGS